MSTPVQKFGKDHWSLLAYVETRCVDGSAGIGALDRNRMRCNQERHPLLGGSLSAAPGWKPQYSTRLAGFFEFKDRAIPAVAIAAGFMLDGHDDWDCLDDLEACGFVEILSTANGAVRLTPAGLKVAAALREHKATGGMFATFSMPAPLVQEPVTP